MRKLFQYISYLIVCLIPITAVLSADSDPVVDSGVRYAQLAYVDGDVMHQPGSALQEQIAQVNYPILPGDRLITGSDGLAEIQIDDGSVVWLGSDSKYDMQTLDFTGDGSAQRTEMKLWVGDMYVRFRRPANPESIRRIDFGSGTLESAQNGLVRIQRESGGARTVSVLDGEIALNSGGTKTVITAGHAMRFDPESGNWETVRISDKMDSFDEWVSDRDESLSANVSKAEHVPPEMRDQAAEMDNAGKWVFNAHFDCWCWAPYVSMGWVPYHYGYWDWIPGWGWTWIPYEPWGWVPYHYGYWAFYYECGWIWVPHWRWGPHWAAWRCDGRSVHWVPISPDDPVDRAGRLRANAVPVNSKLKIGIPVESSMQLDPQIQNHLAASGYSGRAAGSVWRNTPPRELKFMDSPGKMSGRELRISPGGRMAPGRGRSLYPGTRNAPGRRRRSISPFHFRRPRQLQRHGSNSSSQIPLRPGNLPSAVAENLPAKAPVHVSFWRKLGEIAGKVIGKGTAAKVGSVTKKAGKGLLKR